MNYDQEIYIWKLELSFSSFNNYNTHILIIITHLTYTLEVPEK